MIVRVLLVIDRTLSTVLGRPCCVQDEEYVFFCLHSACSAYLTLGSFSHDLEYPIECDDQYWFHEDPALAFKQPAGKPSLITAFNCVIRLNQIQSCTLRTIVSA